MEAKRHTTMEVRDGNGQGSLTPEDVIRFFEDGYREIEILTDGTLRERSDQTSADETVTRSLKTGRTWY